MGWQLLPDGDWRSIRAAAEPAQASAPPGRRQCRNAFAAGAAFLPAHGRYELVVNFFHHCFAGSCGPGGSNQLETFPGRPGNGADAELRPCFAWTLPRPDPKPAGIKSKGLAAILLAGRECRGRRQRMRSCAMSEHNAEGVRERKIRASHDGAKNFPAVFPHPGLLPEERTITAVVRSRRSCAAETRCSTSRSGSKEYADHA